MTWDSTWELPGYRIEALLGTGSSGDVWRASEDATGTPVALKRIRRGGAGAALAEAALLRSLDHPHLVRLHAVEHAEDDLVLVLDLAEGGALSALLARRGRLTVGEVITALAPVGAALAYAHNAGIVHGDVSAANVLFTADGRPLLADLGVARLIGTAAPTRTTPEYADPAVAAGGPPTTASDVFMLAGVALHALTGAPPWTGPDARSVFLRAASGAPTDATRRLATCGMPDAVRAVLERALSLDPAQRGTAADFALDLRHAAEPVAVELHAGRPAQAPRSVRGLVGSWPLEQPSSEPVQDGSDSARPEPGGAESDEPVPFAAPPTTAGARADSGRRPAARRPAGGRHLAAGNRPARSSRPSPALLLALAGLLGGMIVWLCWPSNGSHAAQASGRTPPPTQSRQPSAPAARTSAPPPTSPAGPAAILNRLDWLRAQAFAQRNAALLARVYASPALRERDQALLYAIVPAGCGLRGVHTDFSGVRVSARTATTLTVRATSRVGPAALVCGGTADAAALGSAPRQVDMVLVRGADGYRIGQLTGP